MRKIFVKFQSLKCQEKTVLYKQITHSYRNLDTQTSREINKFTLINLHS